MRKTYGNEFRAKVALAALKGDKTLAELSSEFDVHPTMISNWKTEAKEGLASIFAKRDKDEVKALKEANEALYTKIGRIEVENDWLRKKLKV